MKESYYRKFKLIELDKSKFPKGENYTYQNYALRTYKQIEVVCEKGVTAEYTAQSIWWLAEVDGTLVRKIC